MDKKERYFIGEIKGLTMVGAKGRVIGKILDLALGLPEWRVTKVSVLVDSKSVADLGLKKPFWGKAVLTVEARHVSSVTDVAVLDLSLEELARELEHARAVGEDATAHAGE